MNFVLDTHTHTIASGHAYSTMKEMITSAQNKNLQALGITEHAHNMPGTCEEIYFMNYNVIPRKWDNLYLMLGIEADIVDYEGTIDVSEIVLSRLDYVIASLHGNCYTCGTKKENTNAILKAIQNPYVNIIGHPDNSQFDMDYEEIVKAAKENDVLLELNNTSLQPYSFRKNARENDIKILNLCKKYGAYISLGTDAHIYTAVGDFDLVKEVLLEVDFPEELIVNTSVEKFLKFIDKKRSKII